MATTLATLRTKVQERAGIDADDSLFPASVLTSLINAALAEVATLFDWPWLHEVQTSALVADQADYTPTGVVTRIKYATVVYPDGEETSLDAWRRQDTPHYFSGVPGCPRAYSEEGGTITLHPTPTSGDVPADLRLGLVVAEPALVADADSPLLPDHYVDILVAAAAHKCAIRAQNETMMVALASEKATWFQVMRDQNRRHLAPPRVQVTRDWYSRG